MSVDYIAFLVAACIIAVLSFLCGYFKGRCDEMDSQKTVDIRMESPRVTVMERAK